MRRIVTLLASLALAHAGELHLESRTCDPDRMRQLLSQRPPLNELDENGMTPLHVAIDSRKRACITLLLQAGADRNAQDRHGRTPVDAAAQIPDSSDRFVMDYMLKNFGKPISQQSQEPVGPMPWSLEHSVTHRQANVTKTLLKMGVDPNAIGTKGTTPLADAALKDDLENVRILLERGAQPNASSQTGTQPIHDAALGDSAEVIRELVRNGADVNARTRDEGQTPLYIAAAMGKMKAAEALVALGADLRIKDSKGRTPLDAAEQAGLTEVVAFLRRIASSK